MAKFTPVYSAFLGRIFEVHLLAKQAAVLEREGFSSKNSAAISALCRGAVVLLSSHIEAYVKELGEHALDRVYRNSVCRSRVSPDVFYHISKDRIESLQKASNPSKIVKNIRDFITSEGRYWETKGGFPDAISSEKFNSGFANPKFDKVKSYFGRFGYSAFETDYSRALAGQAQANRNGLDHIIDTRNLIAHGNPLATKTPTEVIQFEHTAKLFCRTCDQIFSDWCRSNLCRIR